MRDRQAGGMAAAMGMGILLGLAGTADAADPPAPPEPWVDLTANLQAGGASLGTGNVEVHSPSGAVYVMGFGSVSRSTDHGQTWTVIGKDPLGGKCWHAGGLDVDPNRPGRVAAFFKHVPTAKVRGGITLNDGETWQEIKRTSLGGEKIDNFGWSWGRVDWTPEEPTFLLARMHHESRLYLSDDAGQTWALATDATQFGGFYDPANLVCWIPEDNTTMHSSDGGQTWQPTGQWEVTALFPARKKETLVWVVRDGVIVSADKGQTWTHPDGKLEDAHWGPFFGPTKNNMLVVTLEGVYQTADGGATWTRIAENATTAVAKVKKKFRMDWHLTEADWAWDYTKHRLYSGTTGQLLMLDLTTIEAYQPPTN